MLETNCEIDGLIYKLKYLKKNTVDGEQYKGILFMNNAFGFSCTVKGDSMVLFDPSFTHESRKTAILKAIAANRRK